MERTGRRTGRCQAGSDSGTGGIKEATLGEGDDFSVDVVGMHLGGSCCHQGYSLGISRTEVKTGCEQCGRRRGRRCSVGGAEGQCLTAAPQVREGSIQEAPGSDPPTTLPAHPQAHALSPQTAHSFPDVAFVNVIPLAWLPDLTPHAPVNLLDVPNNPVQVPLL